ncbi:MAG TPA: exosortase-dependent surface protein XDP1 [Cellvibrio sp.]
MRSLISFITATILGAAVSASALAVPVTINLAPNTAGYVSSFNYTSTEANLTLTGWSNKSTGNKAIAQDQIARWSGSGVGVENQNSPQHAVDNSSGDYDALLFSFSKVVDLNKLGIGWYQTDADVSVLAYTGATPFSGNLNGFGSNWAALLSNGWSVVGNYNRNGTGTFNVNPADVKSQYWLVGAYNSAYGGSLSQKNDYFKLNSVTFEAVKVPESGTVLLFAMGLLGLVAARRRTA